jgi:hypothetical protein
MDRLTYSFNRETKQRYHPAIVAAMELARKKMDRYYGLTDNSQIYRIAMVLHPGLKFKYFEEEGWDEVWIETAGVLVRREYCANYEKDVSSGVNASPAKPTGYMSFGSLRIRTRTTESELEQYLSSSPVQLGEGEDPMQWWVKNKHVYPNLHRMALDFLSVPGLY